MHQLYRKPTLVGDDDDSAEIDMVTQKLKKDRKEVLSLINPDERSLLRLAGGDIDMSRISGGDGIHLRSVIAMRVSHYHILDALV